MEAHADRYSSAFSLDAYRKLQAGKIPQSDMWKYSSYWYADFDGMAQKTMLRQLISKWGIMSIEMQRAFDSDEAAISEDGKAEYIDGTFVSSEPVRTDADEAETPAEGNVESMPAEAAQDAQAAFFDGSEV